MMKKVLENGTRGCFNGALLLESSVMADADDGSAVADAQVSEFLGNRELEDAMAALHEFFGLAFYLRRRGVGFQPKSEWLYELTAWHDDEFLFRDMQNGGRWSMCWTSVNLNDARFTDGILDRLHGGLRLFSWDAPRREYVFVAQVPPFATRNELEMKLALQG